MRLRRAIINWLAKEDMDDCQPGRATKVRSLGYPNQAVDACCDSSSTDPSPEADSILNFRVYNAVGSYIVEFHRYDKHNDRRNTSLYTISHNDDFGEAISKITAAEIIKQ